MFTYEVVWTVEDQPNAGVFKVFRCGNKDTAAKFVEDFLLPTPNSRILDIREVVGVETSSDEDLGFSELTTKTNQSATGDEGVQPDFGKFRNPLIDTLTKQNTDALSLFNTQSSVLKKNEHPKCFGEPTNHQQYAEYGCAECSFEHECALIRLSQQPSNDAVKQPTADDYQIGGSHYKDLPIQPWHVMEVVLSREEFIGFLKGNYIKYAMRHKSPEDVEKAKHYKEKLREIEVTHGNKISI